jgi:hypothetical protein
LIVWRVPCWLLGGHVPLLTQARDDQGALVVPHRLVWRCRRCGKELGQTVLRVETRAPASK